MQKKKNEFYKRETLFVFTCLATIIYIVWRILYTIPFGEGNVALLLGIGLLIIEFIGMLELFEHYYNMSDIIIPEKQKPPINWYPDVDVLIATYNEPEEILEKTINGCINMDYPDKNKVHIYICDDNRRENIELLAKKMGVNYIKRADNKHAKAGNYNNALSVTSSPLIATFDADMIPMRNFLLTMVPYFYEEVLNAKLREEDSSIKEKKIGFIQSPQCFYNPDLFRFNLYSEGQIPDEQDYFYQEVQVSRNKSNAVIYGGSNTVIARKALMEVGGFFTGVITEDFATGVMIQSKGYTCYAINDIVAAGLSPDDLKSLINQRRRWARGCIQTMKETGFLYKRGWSFRQRMCYLSSVLYWYSPIKRLFYLISPIAFAVFSIIVVKCTIDQVLVFWLPMYLFQARILKILSGNIRNTKWSNVYETIMFPSLLLPVILETFGITNRTFAVTRKGKKKDKENLHHYQLKNSIVPMVLAFFSLLGIVNCVGQIFITGNFAMYSVIVFWLMNNLYTLLMAVFFANGRAIKRQAERYRASIPCEIKYNDKIITAKTVDISENGFSFLLPSPVYIPDDREVSATLANDRCKSIFFCRTAKVNEVRDGYIYAVYITKISDFKNKMNLFSIVYDRLPTLARNLDDANSFFNDVIVNIKKRAPHDEFINRRQPRINLQKRIRTIRGDIVTIINFNFSFILVHNNNNYVVEELEIPIDETLRIKCRLVNNFNNVKENYLYRIDNLSEFVYTSQFMDTLNLWISEYKYGGSSKIKNNFAMQGEDDEEFNERDFL